MRRLIIVLVPLFHALFGATASAQNVLKSCGDSPRRELRLREGWKFTREDNARFSQVGYDDRQWESVVVPHDWAIYGPYSPDIDKQFLAISQDGQKTPIYHIARTGGLPFVGVGWYRTSFEMPRDCGRVWLRFDGAMSNARVYVNGREAIYWPYGYNSFWVDITNLIDEQRGRQELAVRLDNPDNSSRWYPGAGLYRNVYVVFAEAVHIAEWGTYITTPQVTDEWAQVNVKTTINYPSEEDLSSYRLRTTILYDGVEVAHAEAPLREAFGGVIEQNLRVEQPQLWDIQ